MTWNQLTFITTGDKSNELAEHLSFVGALAVTLKDAGDEPIFEPEANRALWSRTIVVGLFDEGCDINNILNQLLIFYPNGQLPDHHIDTLEDNDWERSWMDYYEPINYGHNLWVIPSWCNVIDETATNIKLDPGLAFGTGSHETTTLCLNWLAENPPVDQRIVDFGCGSGILAIAGLKLGAKQALGIDISDQALEASRHNASLNQINDSDFILQLSLSDESVKYDLVIANILANPLLTLADKIAGLCKSKGSIVLSGILNEQVDLIQEKYAQWFGDFNVESKGDWARVVGIRK